MKTEESRYGIYKDKNWMTILKEPLGKVKKQKI